VWGLVYLGNETNDQTTKWARNKPGRRFPIIRHQLGKLVANAVMFHDRNVIFIMDTPVNEGE
jgi:hypothetical protein